jgi:hypothetical protein
MENNDTQLIRLLTELRQPITYIIYILYYNVMLYCIILYYIVYAEKERERERDNMTWHILCKCFE